MAPAPVVDDPLAAGRADLGAAARVVEHAGDLGGQGLAVAGRHQEGGLAVGADDLGQGAAGGGHQRARRSDMASMAGSEKPS